MVKKTILKAIVYLLLLLSGAGACLGFFVISSTVESISFSSFLSGSGSGSDGEEIGSADGTQEENDQNEDSQNNDSQNNDSQDSDSQNEDIVIIDEDASAAEDASAQNTASATESASAAEAASTEDDASEGGIHSYTLVKDDCSWSEAFEKAKNAGGYLARINSQEEYQYIVNLINSEGSSDVILYQIGGRRNSDSQNYYWVDENNALYGESLNTGDYWTVGTIWLSGNPSYSDSYNGDTIDETCLVLYSYQDSWVLNDSADDIVDWYPPHAGKTGYIIEFE